MGNKSSLMLQDEEIKQISDDTGFTPIQIEKLYSRFAHLDRSNCGSLNKNDLLSIPELAINPLCDRLIQMFFANSEQDKRINFKDFMRVLATFRSNNNGSVNPKAKNDSKTLNNDRSSGQDISIVTGSNNSKVEKQKNRPEETENESGEALTKKTRDNEGFDGLHRKLLFIFKIYDVDNDGRVSFNDLRDILKLMVGNYIEDVQLDKIATRAFVEVDEDCDGFIGFGEFCKVFSGKDLNDKLRVKFFN